MSAAGPRTRPSDRAGDDEVEPAGDAPVATGADSPADRTPSPVPVAEGDLLAGRYRLQQRLPSPQDSPASAWLAEDEVLARPVVVKALPVRTRAASAFLSAARAGAGAAGALARVYDAAAEQRSGRRTGVSYVIEEKVDGETLPELLRDGPLPVEDALDLGVQLADALVDLHAAGLAHGRLHPGNVVVDAGGRLRLTDAGTAFALRDPGGRPEPAGDVQDAAAVVYALLTGRWPQRSTGQPARGLPPAPQNERGDCSPHQVRAGVPRAVDSLVERALRPGSRPALPPVGTAQTLRDGLQRLAADVAREHRETSYDDARPRRGLRRSGIAVAALAVLAAVGGICWSLGLSVGEVPPLDQGLGLPSASPAAPGAVAPVAIDLRTVPVADYDPYGRPPSEKPDQVVNAHDGEPSTAWATDLYRSDRFGGLKPGVGLVVDLGTPTDLAEVDVDLTDTGTGLELRAGDAVGGTEASLPVVATSDGRDGVTRLVVPPGTPPARFWLVWVTRLPREGSQYRAGIDELQFLRR